MVLRSCIFHLHQCQIRARDEIREKVQNGTYAPEGNHSKLKVRNDSVTIENINENVHLSQQFYQHEALPREHKSDIKYHSSRRFFKITFSGNKIILD